MIRPLTTTSVFVMEKKASNKKRKKNDGTAEAAAQEPTRKKAKTPEEIAEADSFAKELFKLGPEYFPDVLIGIDPGMRSLVTAVSVGRLRCRRRRKRRGRRREGRPQRKQKNENLKKREPWYAGVIHAMPSFKTASYDTYFQRLRFFWTHLRFLLAFSAEQAFLRWRFTQDRAKMTALDTLAK
ncbi:hypothetical protein V7S43_013708 [Phytophthora oleae]|uniref:Uncharacterized protein n=1 Tax=Phytophthora oleae TaxID=2107226 RepID=A0ABD3F7R3_9STRA